MESKKCGVCGMHLTVIWPGMRVASCVMQITAECELGIMAEGGVGHVVTLGGLVSTTESSPLCFRLLEPRLETGLNIVWKKYQVFSPAAEVFLQKIQDRFGETV